MNCDVCGKRIEGHYVVIFRKQCCSDACAATLYDTEYDLPPGTTLNEILYQRAKKRNQQADAIQNQIEYGTFD